MRVIGADLRSTRSTLDGVVALAGDECDLPR
jgi:hypothetical protein